MIHNNWTKLVLVVLLSFLLNSQLAAQTSETLEVDATVRFICRDDRFDHIEITFDDAYEGIIIQHTASYTNYTYSRVVKGETMRLRFAIGYDPNWQTYQSDILTIQYDYVHGRDYNLPENRKPCADVIDEPDVNPYGYYGFECGGLSLSLPALAGMSVYIDGNQYDVNYDGSFSWVIPEGMVWDWYIYDELEDGNLVAYLSSDGEQCITEVYSGTN